MEKLMIQESGYRGDGCDNSDNSNFNFSVSVKKIIEGEEKNVLYQIVIKTVENECVVEGTIQDLIRQKFLQKGQIYVENENAFYKEFHKVVLTKIFTEDEILYRTGRNGLNMVNGKWVFAFSNGAIDKDGFRTEISSGVEGAVFPEEAIVSLEKRQEIIQKLFNQYNRNYEVFYIIFLTVLMSITNKYFRTIGESKFMKLTLWLEGKTGSGKSELAQDVGMHIYADRNLNKNIVSITGNRGYALKCLEKANGYVCVLDDVKFEKTRERRNHIINIIDDYIRSVFQGRMTDAKSIKVEPKWIDTCAIITGEYLETIESQNARIIHLNVDGFVKDKNNSETLYMLKDNPLWLTIVCGGYMQWLLKRMEESSFADFLKLKLNEMRKSENPYEGISNGARLKENRNMLEMAALLAEMYFAESTMPEEFTKCFRHNAEISINAAVDNTFCLLGGEEVLMINVMEKILRMGKVRKAKYQKSYLLRDDWKYVQEQFWLNEEEEFLWIEDYKKSLWISGRDEYDLYDDKPCLIIQQKRLETLIKSEIYKMLQEKKISSNSADKILSNITLQLKKMQIIYKQYRSDNKWGKTVLYPVYRLRTEYGKFYGYNEYSYEENIEKTICNVDYESVIQINTEHPCVADLKQRMNIMDDTYVDTDDWEIRGKDKKEVYKVRKSFINGKSLYKE